MRWLSRGFWLLAWSVWLWLGVGLSRELPKVLGPTAFQLPNNSKEDMIAFLHNRPSIFTLDDGADDRLPIIRLRNERTGDIELEVKSDGAGIPRSFGFFNSFKHGFHGRCEAYPRTPNTTWPVFVLNLTTGKWNRFDDVGYEPTFHPTKPWVMFNRSDVDPTIDAVVVIDLETGRRVFDVHSGIQRDLNAARRERPFFIGGDRIGIPTVSNDGRKSPSLEIWSIEKGLMIRRVDGVKVGRLPNSSPAGIVCWYDVDIGSACVTHVFGAEAARIVCSIPPEVQRVANGPYSFFTAPTFTADGKRILSAPAGGLFDIAAGRRVWDAADHESVWIVRSPDRFEVSEHWSIPVFGRTLDFYTFAVRRLDDGSFLTRSHYSTLAQFRSNADETLFLEHGKSVRELPLRVSWLYLGLAQAILALPMVGVWEYIRWRRKRRSLIVSPP
jgi:hypothetical protein